MEVVTGVIRGLRLCLLACFGVVLLACGGGGGSGSGSSAPQLTDVVVSGKAAKGIIQGATVEAWRLPIKVGDEHIAQSRTSEKGEFSLTLSSFPGGAVLLKVLPGNGAKVVCDAPSCSNGEVGTVAFGEAYDLYYELQSLLYIEKGAKTVAAHITPLTDLVYRNADGKFSAADVDKANDYVKNLFGLTSDPGKTEPVDLTDKTADSIDMLALQVALLNASFEALGKKVDDALAALSQATETQLRAILEALDDIGLAVQQNNDAISDVQDALKDIKDAVEESADNCENVCGGNSGGDTDEPPGGESGVTNLDRAKALLATARKVTIEAYEDIESLFYDDADGYESNSLIAQVRDVHARLGEETVSAMNGAGEVIRVASYYAVMTMWDDELSTEASLRDAAERYYDDTVESWCYYDSWNTSWYQQCMSQEQARKDAYLNHFEAGSLVKKANGNWALSGIRYRPDFGVPDRMTGALEVKAPEVFRDVRHEGAEDEEVWLGLLQGESVIEVVSARFAYQNDIAFTVNSGSSATLMLDEDFWFNDLDNDPAPKVSKVETALEVSLAVSGLSFAGTVEAEAVRSARHEAMNRPYGELFTPIPSRLVLDGRFTGMDGLSLDLVLRMNIDNADQYGFLQHAERDDLTGWVYSANKNSLTVTHGKPGNRVTATFAYENGDLTVTCKVVGEAGCDNGSQYQAGWWGYGEEDIRQYFEYDAEWLLWGIWAKVPGEGSFYVGPREWWTESGQKVLIDGSKTSGSLPAYLAFPDLDYNEEGSYLKGSFQFKTTGKLAAGLPEGELDLRVDRTGFRAGEARATLKWGNEILHITYPYTGDESRQVVFKDTAGTEMTLQLDDLKDITGKITKDGVVYGTLRKEGVSYMVSWKDGTIETLY